MSKLIPHTRLTVDQMTKVAGHIPNEIFNYLFKGCLIGINHAQTKIINHLVKKLHDELKRLNLPATYGLDHESIVADVLERLNFRIDVLPIDTSADDVIARNADRLPDPSPGGHSNSRDDGRGTTQVLPGKANTRSKSPSNEKETGGRISRPRNGAGKKAAGDKKAQS